MSTNPTDVIKHGVQDARQAMREAVDRLRQQRARIDELEIALNRMVLAHENLESDTEGKYPPQDAGCIVCTVGTVPDRLNAGLCAYHTARKLLGNS